MQKRQSYYNNFCILKKLTMTRFQKLTFFKHIISLILMLAFVACISNLDHQFSRKIRFIPLFELNQIIIRYGLRFSHPLFKCSLL